MIREPEVGLVQSFQVGDSESVHEFLKELNALRVAKVRTEIAIPESFGSKEIDWYVWVLSEVASHAEVTPCFAFEVALEVRSSDSRADAQMAFAQEMLESAGKYFDYVEFRDLSGTEDKRLKSPTDSRITGDDTYRKLIELARKAGKKIVFGGIDLDDIHKVEGLFRQGLAKPSDVIGLRGPASSGQTWSTQLAKLRALLGRHLSTARIWITETGHGSRGADEFGQVRALIDVICLPVDRVYWNCLQDSEPVSTWDREIGGGLKRSDGTSKLLHRQWKEGGLDRVRRVSEYPSVHAHPSQESPALVIGGAGFIGTNLADRLLSSGTPVVVFDSLARPGVERNLEWLRHKHGSNVEFQVGDVRDRRALRSVVERAGKVFNFAAQVAVTTSLVDPIDDFERNARGTLNVLEEIRRLDNPPPLIFTSTNKVYGGLEDVPLSAIESRYEPDLLGIRTNGIGESRPLDFHSPYGCSKGAADQYVIDYARTFGIPAVVFRMSCIYGPHQCGTEDQGWVAHFLLQILKDRPIVLYGDGKQVRDILFVSDLVDAFLLALDHVDRLSGSAFNMGGGVENSVSLLELLRLMEGLHGSLPKISYSDWRPGDQRYYVSDTRKFQNATGWKPKYSAEAGIAELYGWLREANPQTIPVAAGVL